MRQISKNYPVDRRRLCRECSKKKGFNTSKEANQEIHRILQKQHVCLHYYQCSYCQRYHLTKKNPDSPFT